MPLLNKTRLVLLVAILSAAAGAVVFKTPSVLFLLATLIAAPILASAMGKWMSRGLRVSRQMPVVGSVGDQLRARLIVRNSGLIPALLVHAQGRGVPEKPRRASWRRGSVRARRGAAHEDEKAPFFEVAGESELVVPILMPGASFSGEVAWTLLRRGLYAWPGARAGTFDPIALSDALPARSAPAELLILPRPLKLRRLQLGGGSPSTQPLRRAAASVDASEVHGVRPYQPGEGGRRIHWRATARTGELHVIEWEEETAADLTVLIDTHAPSIAGAAHDDSLELSIIAAASVAAFLLERGQRARIFWWADETENNASASADASGQMAGVGGARLMRVEARHQAGLTLVLTALAQIEVCHCTGATLSALSARVQRATGDEGALLLGSDEAAWEQALAPWHSTRHSGGAHGLAFESASWNEPRNPGFTLRAGGGVTATMQRVDASKARPQPQLPARVRRLKRSDSLVDALEKNF